MLRAERIANSSKNAPHGATNGINSCATPTQTKTAKTSLPARKRRFRRQPTTRNYQTNPSCSYTAIFAMAPGIGPESTARGRRSGSPIVPLTPRALIHGFQLADQNRCLNSLFPWPDTTMGNSRTDAPTPRISPIMTSPLLKRIPREAIQPGDCLPGRLVDHLGKTLVPADEYVTAQHLARLDRYAVSGLFGGEDWADDFLVIATAPGQARRAAQTMRVDQLCVGTRLPENLHDRSGVLLLAAGTEITQRFIQLLERRNVVSVTLGFQAATEEPEECRRDRGDRLDARLAGIIAQPIPIQLISRFERPRLSIASLRAEAERGLEIHATTSDRIIETCQKARSGRKTSSDAVREPIAEFVKMVSQDFDLLPLIVSCHTPANEYLFSHCVNVSLLSMSIAAQIGWPQDRIADIGLGALLHDVGMLKVPETIRLAPRAITPEEREQVEIHPYHTLELLDGVKGLPTVAKYVAYQVHERWNSSGYPNRRSGAELHPYAQVVSIADAYAAMTRTRPHRPAVSPYDASTKILRSVAEGAFDRQFTRAFLDAISLFPVGSYVELTGGSYAQVLRANPGMHTRPIVEELSVDGARTGHIVNLAESHDIQVVNEAEAPHTRTPVVSSG